MHKVIIAQIVFVTLFIGQLSFSAKMEFIAHQVEAHCSVDDDFVLKHQDVGSLVVMVPITMVLATLFWIPIWHGHRDLELYFYAAASSSLAATLFYKIWESTKMYNVLEDIPKSAS